MVAARSLVRVFLKGVQLNDIFVETQRRAIPDEAVYAVAPQRHFV